MLTAACFYGFIPILIAQEQSLPRLATILKRTNADALVAGAGSVPMIDLLMQYDGLKQVVWVVARTSRHLDWNEVSEGEGGKAEISTWHEVIDEQGSSGSSELPALDPTSQAPNVILVSEPTERLNDYEIVEFTQKVSLSHSKISLAPTTNVRARTLPPPSAHNSPPSPAPTAFPQPTRSSPSPPSPRSTP